MLASIPAAPRFIVAVLRFIVGVQSQEVALLLEAGARMSLTVAVADAVGNKPNRAGLPSVPLHCALMPAALMIGHHLSISAFW
jgi:hypothetical protein